jgi:hypothetical protein
LKPLAPAEVGGGGAEIGTASLSKAKTLFEIGFFAAAMTASRTHATSAPHSRRIRAHFAVSLSLQPTNPSPMRIIKRRRQRADVVRVSRQNVSASPPIASRTASCMSRPVRQQ